MQIKDIYWLAGLLDGEGSFGFWRGNANKKYRRPFIMVGLTDEDLLLRASQILNSKVYGPYQYKNKKPFWNTYVFGKHAIAWMMSLYSIMSKRRQNKILSVVKEWKDSNYKQYKPRRKAIAA